MTQEEKARAYDEAKARMSIAYNSNRCSIGFMNEIFPELKENDDKKVRNELIDAIRGLWENDALPIPLSAKRKDKWITWLVKHGNASKEVEIIERIRDIISHPSRYIIPNKTIEEAMIDDIVELLQDN